VGHPHHGALAQGQAGQGRQNQNKKASFHLFTSTGKA